jgi:hypothetical protein
MRFFPFDLFLNLLRSGHRQANHEPAASAAIIQTHQLARALALAISYFALAAAFCALYCRLARRQRVFRLSIRLM